MNLSEAWLHAVGPSRDTTGKLSGSLPDPSRWRKRPVRIMVMYTFIAPAYPHPVLVMLVMLLFMLFMQ